MNRFFNRVALITGGGGDIGSTIARRLSEQGATVVIVDARRGPVETIAAGLRELGLPVHAATLDVTDPDAVRACVAGVHDRHGGPHILVTCAGLLRDRPIGQMTQDDWNSVIGSHLTGTFNLVQSAQGYMVDQGYGRMVLFSSDSARGVVNQTNYAAAKAGIEGMTRTLALELGRSGIIVNAVAPGFVDSTMMQTTAAAAGRDLDEFRRHIAERTAVGRVVGTADVAWVVEFLAAEQTSMMTGQVLTVRGAP